MCSVLQMLSKDKFSQSLLCSFTYLENCSEQVSVEGLRAQLWEDGVLNPEELPFE